MFCQIIKQQKLDSDPKYQLCYQFAKSFLNINDLQANAVAKGMMEHKEWLEYDENDNIT